MASYAPENMDGSQLMQRRKAIRKLLHLKVMTTEIIVVTGKAAMQQNCRRKGRIMANDLNFWASWLGLSYAGRIEVWDLNNLEACGL